MANMRWKWLNEIHRNGIITLNWWCSFIEMFTERATTFNNDAIRISIWCPANGESIYTSSFQLLFRISTAHFFTKRYTGIPYIYLWTLLLTKKSYLLVYLVLNLSPSCYL